MKIIARLLLAFSCATCVVFAEYVPSGWRPEGPEFELPIQAGKQNVPASGISERLRIYPGLRNNIAVETIPSLQLQPRTILQQSSALVKNEDTNTQFSSEINDLNKVNPALSPSKLKTIRKPASFKFTSPLLAYTQQEEQRQATPIAAQTFAKLISQETNSQYYPQIILNTGEIYPGNQARIQAQNAGNVIDTSRQILNVEQQGYASSNYLTAANQGFTQPEQNLVYQQYPGQLQQQQYNYYPLTAQNLEVQPSPYVYQGFPATNGVPQQQYLFSNPLRIVDGDEAQNPAQSQNSLQSFEVQATKVRTNSRIVQQGREQGFKEYGVPQSTDEPIYEPTTRRPNTETNQDEGFEEGNVVAVANAFGSPRRNKNSKTKNNVNYY